MTCADALELVSSPFQSLPLPPALINQIIGGVTLVSGLVPLLGPGGPCA
jgi:hypothetical protein